MAVYHRRVAVGHRISGRSVAQIAENRYFSLEQFNRDLWLKLDALNHENFKKKDYSRYDQWLEERSELMPLPSMHYEYMERRTAKVSGDFHVRFDNAYYTRSIRKRSGTI